MVEFVGSRLARRVLLWVSGFHPSTKTNISKFQFDQDKGPGCKQVRADVASKYCNLIIIIIIIIILNIIIIFIIFNISY